MEREQIYQQWCVPLERGRNVIFILVLPGMTLSRTWLINAYTYQPSHPNPGPRGQELFGKSSCKWNSAVAQRSRIGIISLKPDFHIWDNYPVFAPFRVNRGKIVLWSETVELPTLGWDTLKRYFFFLPVKEAQKHLPWNLDHEKVQKSVSLEPVCQQISYSSWLGNSSGCRSQNFSVL